MAAEIGNANQSSVVVPFFAGLIVIELVQLRVFHGWSSRETRRDCRRVGHWRKRSDWVGTGQAVPIRPRRNTLHETLDFTRYFTDLIPFRRKLQSTC